MCVGVCKGIWRDRDLGCCSALAANGASKQANRQTGNQAIKQGSAIGSTHWTVTCDS